MLLKISWGISEHWLLHRVKLDFGQSRPKRPKIKIHRIEKIRPFFQSAHQADSKNAKKFEKSSFFEKICLRKQARVHRPSDFFCSKSCTWWVYDLVQVLKKLFDSFQKLKIWCPEIESAVASYPSCPIWVLANLFGPNLLNDF